MIGAQQDWPIVADGVGGKRGQVSVIFQLKIAPLDFLSVFRVKVALRVEGRWKESREIFKRVMVFNLDIDVKRKTANDKFASEGTKQFS